MNKNLFHIFVILFLMLFLFQIQILAQEDKKVEALQALKAKHFSTAIYICLEELAKNPDDYEFQFILARAYSFSGQWDRADEIISNILKDHPGNIDVLLLKARIQGWRKNFCEAKDEFKYILSLEPKNEEALTGLADTAQWEGNFKEAEKIYLGILEEFSDKPEIYYKLGLIYRNMGNYKKARAFISEAAKISPESEEYKKAFKNTNPKISDNHEFRYQHNIQAFNDNREDYIDNQFMLYLNIQKVQTSMLFWFDQTKRFGSTDHQYKLELYPRLWPKSYGHFYYTFSPNSIHYPSSSYLLEAYQSLLSSAEVSLGYRRMNFKENPVSIYSGSLGYYWNQYYSWLRIYYTPEEEGNSLSWTAHIRRYFSIDDYVFFGFGVGSRPFEIMTLDELWTSQTQIFLAGFNFFILKRLRIQFFYTHQDEKQGLKRNSFLIISGFRF